jgi:uncharacterized protein (DUF2141 family)
MKSILFLIPFFLMTAPAFSQNGTIVLTVEGLTPEKGGNLSAGVFERSLFPQVGKQLVGKDTAVSGKTMRIVFRNVPAGAYALVAFQDADADGKLRTNMVGFPKDPIGFSRDAKIRFGPPAFDDAVLMLRSGETLEHTLVLR